jgi:hypothetical protein
VAADHDAKAGRGLQAERDRRTDAPEALDLDGREVSGGGGLVRLRGGDGGRFVPVQRAREASGPWKAARTRAVAPSTLGGVSTRHLATRFWRVRSAIQAESPAKGVAGRQSAGLTVLRRLSAGGILSRLRDKGIVGGPHGYPVAAKALNLLGLAMIEALR